LVQVLLRELCKRRRRELRGRRRVVVIVVVIGVRCLRVRKHWKKRREKQREQEVYYAAHEARKCRYIWCPAQATKSHARTPGSRGHAPRHRAPGRTQHPCGCRARH